jgi:hypothetical protein
VVEVRKNMTRYLRLIPLVTLLAGASCLLTSGQFNVAFDLPNPLDVPGPTSLVRAQVDLNEIETYTDHKENIAGVADAALLGEIENTAAATSVEVWMTPATTTHSTAAQVRGDPSAALVWGPISLGAGERRRIDWDQSSELFVGRQALLDEVRGDGVFTLYIVGPANSPAYHFILRGGVLVVEIDAGV